MRTITIEKTLYKFDELTPSAKSKALDKLRESNDFQFESECVLEDAKECAAVLGIDIKKIYYSGFCSQGDGACFTGNYTFKKDAVKAIKNHAPQDKTLLSIAKDLSTIQKKYKDKLHAVSNHRGHYYHDLCTDISVSLDYDNRIENDDIESVKECMRAYMRWIYRQLEKQYEYINSDEALKETIEANDYEFTEDGRLA